MHTQTLYFIPRYFHIIASYIIYFHVLYFRRFCKQSPLLSSFNSVWQKTPSVSIFDFPGATGLEKGQNQGATFRKFRSKQNKLKWDTSRSMGWERVLVARPPPRARHLGSFPLRPSDSSQFSHIDFV
jgi:hypothetical protein